MAENKGPAPLLPWQRMCATVHQLVRADPWAGSHDPPIRVSCHARAIWLECGPSVSPVEYVIEEKNWWEPQKMGRARILSQRLTVGLREKLEGM